MLSRLLACRKLPRPISLLWVACLLSFLVGCGGGSEDATPAEEPISVNTCSTIGLQEQASSVLKIYNGSGCLFNEKSALVKLEIITHSGDFNLCTGVMVSSTHVLTAGHCVLQASSIAVLFGRSNEAFGAQQAARWKAFGDLQGVVDQTAPIDLAVVTLSRALDLPTLPVLANATPQPGQGVAIYGFGGVDTPGTGLGVLRAGAMRVTYVDDTYIYALHNGSLSNTCRGDSGGPMVATLDGVTGLMGIVSAGSSEDCTLEDLSSFTRLQNRLVLDFLRQHAPGASLI